MPAGRGTVGRVLAEIARNRALSRLLLSYALLSVAEFGEWLALIVYAYARGGATAAGLVAIVQLVPSMLLAPLLSGSLARLGAVRVLTLSYAAGAFALACCAAAILAHAPIVLVYAAAVAFSLALSVCRPLHPVLLPLVVRHPDELTAANVATSWCEGLGTLLGPALAGVLIGAQGPGLVCAVLAACLLGTPLLSRVHLLRSPEQEDEPQAGALAGLRAAAQVIFSRPATRALVAFPAAAAVIEGAIDLLVVVLAVRVLALGGGAAGYLGAAFGAGGVIGGVAAVALVGRRLATPLAAAALVSAVAIGALAFTSTLPVALGLLALAGAARAIQTIAAQTLLQRSTPVEVVVCAFALIESMRDAGLALSSLLVPVLIALGGTKAAFIGAACVAPVVVLLTARRFRRVDAEASIPVVELGVLRRSPIFSALPAGPLEALAHAASYARFPAGATILQQGEAGEDFFIVTHGSVVVSKGAAEIRRLGVGDGFGEIALLRAIARTATVRAAGETTLLSVGREPFLAAMHAHGASRIAAEHVAAQRLAHAG
jgi:hypothetical protein